jgi:hypothetical protein
VRRAEGGLVKPCLDTWWQLKVLEGLAGEHQEVNTFKGVRECSCLKMVKKPPAFFV